MCVCKIIKTKIWQSMGHSSWRIEESFRNEYLKLWKALMDFGSGFSLLQSRSSILKGLISYVE